MNRAFAVNAEAEADARELERIVGGPFVSAVAARWGFANRSDIVTMPNGDRLVVQRYRQRTNAAHRLRAMAVLAGPLAERGITIPAIRRARLDDDPPWAIFEQLRGVPVPEADARGLAGAQFPHLAMQMGDVLRRIASVPADGLDLPGLWADPASLATQAAAWLRKIEAGMSAPHQRILRRSISDTPGLFIGRPAVVAHGDFAPVNILVADNEIIGLLDFESARLADPLFDVAWWAWVVGFHHPADLTRGFSVFARAANVPVDDLLDARLRTLQLLRLLELAAGPLAGARDTTSMWIQRLTATIASLR